MNSSAATMGLGVGTLSIENWRILVIVFAIIVGFSVSATNFSHAQSACLKDGEAVTGELRFVRTKHPNGTNIEVYQLVLGEPICVTESLVDQPFLAKLVHLVLPQDQSYTSLEGQLGQVVSVRGKFVQSHTAWHIGDAVLLNAELVQVPLLIESYVARLSDQDHFNSRGERLQHVWQVIRQDRANYHRFARRDSEDQPDSFFQSAENRAQLERILIGNEIESLISQGSKYTYPGFERLVLNSSPLVKVDIFERNARHYVVLSVPCNSTSC